MGMAGSIESRFPFLDHGVVKAAVNLGLRHKLKFDLTVLDKAHPFRRDKHVVRRVADRYIPAELSQRNKFGFWTTVFQRLNISEDYFRDSYVGELLQLTNSQMTRVLADNDQNLALRLLHIDQWGRICVRGEAEAANVARLREFVAIRSERSGSAPA